METRYILFAVATLAIAACAKTVEQPEPEGTQMTICAYHEGSSEFNAPETKTAVTDGGTRVYWEPADEIKVFFRGNGGRFISQNTQNADVAEFSGTLNVLVGLNEGASGSNALWGLYPYRSDAASDGQSVTTTLPAEQTGRAGSFAKNTHITLACSNSHDLAFYNVTGGVRFSLTQEGIKSVTFQGNGGETLAGRIKLAFDGGVPAIQEVTDGETVLTLNASGGGTFETGKWYYIEAIPGTLSGGFKMVFSKGNETAKISSSGSVTINRGKYGSIAAADEGLIFKSEGGEEPDPASVIQFADPIAKYACVEKFDINGDGEVSYAEAAAVTSMDGLFKDWNTVTSFEEIQYFTGVTSTVGVFDNCSKLESFTVPNFITTLGSFQNCSSLKSVVLPSGLSSLPNNCFECCSALTGVDLPSGITSIPQCCFNGCSALAGIELPANVKTIGNYAFQGCTAIQSIVFPAALTSIGSDAFSGCTSLTFVSFGDGVSIRNGAFNNCTALASVILPADLTSIPSYCFQDCSSLSSISWPAALETIGNRAFFGCVVSKDDSDASMIELPPTVKSIGSQAFCGVRHLKMPSTSAISIESDAFSSGFTRLYVPAGMVEMYKVRTNWSVYANQIYPLSDYPAELSFPVAEAVDLGLSVKWASWNVGASAPEEYGTYFAWGEVEGNWLYDWSTYKWCEGSEGTLTKYINISSYGTVDNKTVLDPEDDAAQVNWGGSWRMPTLSEWSELINNCTWTWTTQNGVNGRLVTSKKNSNSIFLPAAGDRYDAYIYDVGSRGYYLSSSLYNGNPAGACRVYFNSGNVNWGGYDRCSGRSVRPVSE
ncbi:MAG: leucine-rich repeat protein [Bacteroidales bacterium]|nr:leucine-rich repeat protein [Bacteroidales bacterium]